MENPAHAVRVLFIGNSFTARNDVPGLVAAMARACGCEMEHRLVSAGGASLRRHWNKGDALELIRGGRFDFVVLQEQSTLPIKGPQRMFESVRLFDEAIRAAGAKTVLYMTWARRGTPKTQSAITDAYTTIGREIGAIIAPAGEAWRAFFGNHDEPALYDKDGSHPTLAGSYLAASTLFAAMFEKSPINMDVEVPGVSAADAKSLRTAAAQVWRP